MISNTKSLFRMIAELPVLCVLLKKFSKDYEKEKKKKNVTNEKKNKKMRSREKKGWWGGEKVGW